MCPTLALGLLADPAAAAERQNVLVLAARDSLQPAYEQFISGFRAGLSARGGEDRLQLYTEALDFVRFPQAEHKMRMRQFLQEKYTATHIDLLISTSADGLDFVLQHRNALFPNDGFGPGVVPFHRAGARRPHLGGEQPWRWCDFQICTARRRWATRP